MLSFGRDRVYSAFAAVHYFDESVKISNIIKCHIKYLFSRGVLLLSSSLSRDAFL